MLEKSINDCFELSRKRGWDRIYWAVDLHGVIVKPTYDNNIPDVYYDNAIRVLKIISDRKDIKLILYTCSYKEKSDSYLKEFQKFGVVFDYVNRNPEILDNTYSTYSEKLYFNILLDDKAGFDPETDWLVIERCLKNNECLI